MSPRNQEGFATELAKRATDFEFITDFNYITITLEEAQANLKEWCQAALSKRNVILVKRSKGPDVALLGADELSSVIETLDLLGTHNNAARLLAALERAQCR